MNAKLLLLKLHEAGGCDAENDYDKGWDNAITKAIGIVESLTGVSIEEALRSPTDKEYLAAVDVVCMACPETSEERCDGCPVRRTVVATCMADAERKAQRKKRIRFSFHKEFNIEADLSEEEISRITAKDGDIPIRIWEDANDKDDEVPILFERYQEVRE